MQSIKLVNMFILLRAVIFTLATTLTGCLTVDAPVNQTESNEPNLRFTGVITPGEISGERSKQVLGSIEANLLKTFPNALWQTNKVGKSDVILDVFVYSARFNDKNFSQENRTCRRWSEPDKDAKGYIPRLISRNCLDWQVQQTPCLARKYEVDVQIRARQLAQERVIASERKIIVSEQTNCGNETQSAAALQAKVESQVGAWAINILKSPLDDLASKLNITNTTLKQSAQYEANTEIEKPRAEAEESKKKQAELEEQLRLAKLQVKPEGSTTPYPISSLGNRRALVIGNDSYKSVPKLSNAREDARTIASNLTAVGYQVTLKVDLTEKEMKATLRTFSGQVQGGDEVLFFFAGHGVQLGATNYLLPIDIVGDSEAQVRDEALQLQRVLDDMSDRKAKFTLAMIDACRDNPFKSTGRAIGGRGLAPTTAATGQMVIFSAGTGQQALDKLNNADKNKNGLFTRIFVQEMQKPNLSIDRVVKNVRNQVAELAKSVGHEQVPAIYDQVLGDFYFKR